MGNSGSHKEKMAKLVQTGPPPMKPGRLYVNPKDEDQMEIQGYVPNTAKQVVVWVLAVPTVGLLMLFFYWLPHLYVKLTHDKCRLDQAKVVLLKDQYKQWFKSEVKIMHQGESSHTGSITSPAKSLGKNKMADSAKTQLERIENCEMFIRYFVSKKVKYIWDVDKDNFIKLRGLDADHSCSYFHKLRGLTYENQEKRRTLYGLNTIRVHVTSILVLLFKEVLSPFYVFQVFSMCLWYADQYEIYATCILGISTLSIVVTIYQTRKMQRALRNTITLSSIVTVCRGSPDECESISSEDLVPGDVVEIPSHGCLMQCDAVLVSGNCIVNESSLTGESVPVTKTPLPNPRLGKDQTDLIFSINHHSRHVLFCGTQVIQTRYYGKHKVRAVILRTGFSTAKGELVRAILYPKPVDFRFNRQTYWFIGILAFIASLGLIYTIIIMTERDEDVGDIILRALDLITIAVPPALPAALAVGIVFAQSRLKHNQIYCISPRGINICGSINAVCFDKTGTLTEEGLDMQGVVPVNKQRFQNQIRDFSVIPPGPLLSAMVTCHSLTKIEGRIMGDPLDLIMFEATDWVLEEPGEEETRFDMMVPTIVYPKNSTFLSQTLLDMQGDEPSGDEIGILRQFTFSSSLQRMSVITRKHGAANFDLFVKGSPEMISSLSKPDTVPLNFHQMLMNYTQHGYRVIALAWKPLSPKLNYVKAQRITRDQVEKDLNFLGLLVMENCLKPETAPVIQVLREANIRNVMITGDNMLTALSVARECGMVDKTDRIILVQAYPQQDSKSQPVIEFVYADDRETKVQEVMTMDDTSIRIDEDNQRFHFAVTGKSWEIIKQYMPDILSKIVVRGTVFARMGPDQKAQLVEFLQVLGYYVCMCGDGANDCGALKMAHAGISLSEAEASVASPFTSKIPTIQCVPSVIKEGRCALVTSFGIFKYMASYSLTQLVSVLLLYWIGANLTDYEFLFIDLFCITTLSITYGRTAPYPKLVKELPPISLLTAGPILSLIIHIIIQSAVQVYCFLDVQKQAWFVPFHPNDDDDYQSYENSAVFLISSFQYTILAIAFSKGAPFRRTLFSNYLFLANIALCAGVAAWITIYPTEVLADFLEIKLIPPITYRLMYIGIVAINFFVSVIIEMFVIDNTNMGEWCQQTARHYLPVAECKYTSIENEIKENPHWPPVSNSNYDLAAAFQRLDSQHHVPRDGDGDTSAGTVLDDLLEMDDDSGSEKSFDKQGKQDDVELHKRVGRQFSAVSDFGDYSRDLSPLLKPDSSSRVKDEQNGTFSDPVTVEIGGKYITSM